MCISWQCLIFHVNLLYGIIFISIPFLTLDVRFDIGLMINDVSGLGTLFDDHKTWHFLLLCMLTKQFDDYNCDAKFFTYF